MNPQKTAAINKSSAVILRAAAIIARTNPMLRATKHTQADINNMFICAIIT